MSMDTMIGDTLTTIPVDSLYKYSYVGQPYSHPDSRVRYQRYFAANRFVLTELLKGNICYSPIIHSHNLAVLFPDQVGTDFDFWRPADFAMLSKANKMDVLMMDGWKDSYGLSEEIKFCEKHGINVYYHALE